MEPLIIEPSNTTPKVKFDPATGVMLLSGRSTPENSVEFYKQMLDWLDEYAGRPCQRTELNIKLEYFNTSSSKCLLDIFKSFNNLHKAGNDVIVKWYYEEEDEDMQEAGEDYSDLLNVPFEIIEVKE
jgi:hypothetical protein